jgi:hypothetical protein
MIPYFVILFLVLFLLNIEGILYKNKKSFNLLIFIVAFILIIFEGLRSKSVGTDTASYIDSFNQSFHYNKSIFILKTSLEIGYLSLQLLATKISSNYWSILTVISFFSVLSYFKSIRTLSYNFKVSIFIYLTIGTYIFVFNGARQGIAAAICSLAIVEVFNKNKIKYILWVLLASQFHKTALILLPFYFIFNSKFSIKKVIIILVLASISLKLLAPILTLFSEETNNRYTQYIDRNASGGYLFSLFYIVLTLLFILFRKQISKDNIKYYDICLYICIMSSLIYLEVITTGIDINLMRLTLYFSMGYILIWPIIFKDVKIFKYRAIKFSFYLVHIVFFYVYLATQSRLIPYNFNNNI